MTKHDAQDNRQFNERSLTIAKGKVIAADEAFSDEVEQAIASLLLGE